MKKLNVLKRIGGKYFMLNKIKKLIPSHRIFVDVFGGSGVVIFNKKPVDINVYNDLDHNFINFFEVVRNNSEELIRRLELTPYSREEFYNCRDNYKKENEDKIEKARQFYVSIKQSFSGDQKSWSFSKKVQKNNFSFYSSIPKIEILKERLKRIQVECRDWKEIFELYDNKDAFMYCDPPYVYDTRTSKNYYDIDEMTNKDHIEFIDRCLELKSKILISGYEHSIYEKLVKNGWNKEKHEMNILANNTSSSKKRFKKEEIFWYNYDLNNVDTIFEGVN